MTRNENRDSRAKLSLWRLLPLVVIGLALVAFFAFDLDRFLSYQALVDHRQTLLTWRDENAVLVVAAFIGIYATVVAFSLPGAVWMTLAGGFLFGTVLTTLYVVFAATLGAVAIFLVARYALADYFYTKAGPGLRKLEDGFRENALSYLLVLRLVPLFPFWLVNLAPAILGVSLRTFVIATFFGIIPGTFVYSSVGNGLGTVFDEGGVPDLGTILEPRFLVPIIGLAVLSLIPVIYKKFKKSPQA